MHGVRTVAAICGMLFVSLGAATRASGQDIDVAAPAPTSRPLRAFDTTTAVVTESMRHELARVQKAESDYYAANGEYAASVDDLGLDSETGTVVTIDSAGARSYHAVATNPLLPGAQLELVALAPPSGLLGGRQRRRAPADSGALKPDSASSNDDH